jgi:chitin disaccharide deacetylase
MSKTIILCADDFGQGLHISQAILLLATNKRLSAISCMTTEEDWTRHGPSLKSVQSHLDIGLHFNLTHGKGNYCRPLNEWLFRSLLRQIDKAVVEAQLHDQLDRFEAIMGVSPDFIDGHQHVHSFPVMRDVLTQVIKDRFPTRPPYVRTLTPMIRSADTPFKALILKGASYKFSRALDLQEIDHNSQFGGVYSLSPQAPYREFMNFWLQHSITGALLMCHPGISPLKSNFDPIQETRIKEYAYLSSDAFLEDCTKASVVLGRFRDIVYPYSGS